MNIELPENIEYTIKTLEASGFDAYIVGGCVRDSLMGKTPKDWDVTTSALPEQVKEAFPEHVIIDLGLKFGTVALLPHQPPHEPVEITTFRLDGAYSDNRHPESVIFSDNLKEDLSRRDFTVNAMAYNPKIGIVDMFGGKKDLEDGIIRCVGNPDKRFQEDALRIMRAMRFASVFGFTVHRETSNAMLEHKSLLRNISAERIANELNKMIVGQGIGEELLIHRDIIAEIIPELIPTFGFMQNNPHHLWEVYLHTAQSIQYATSDVVIRLTMLFHDIAKPQCYTEKDGIGHFYGHAQISSDIAKEVLSRLKYDNSTIKAVTELVLNHDADIEPRRKHIKRRLNKIGEVRLRQLIEVKKADAMAHAEPYRQERLDKLSKIPSMISEIIEQRQCIAIKDLAVNGSDLMEIGISEGPRIGELLNHLVDMVIDETIENDKDDLLKAARDSAIDN